MTVLIASVVAVTLTSCSSARDEIHVISVMPAYPVTRGVPALFKVVVDVDLESGSSGIAQIGFNDRDVRLYRILERRTLNRGQQRITFETTAVPVDWGRQGDFGLMVNMGPPKSSPSWTPTASSVQPIAVKP
jgi:hypothetical protein